MPHTGPILEGTGDTDYERYVRVPELLALQKKKEELAHPVERLLQTTHQAAELWLHQVDYEIDRAAALIRQDRPHIAADRPLRCRLPRDRASDQPVILDSMARHAYHRL